MLEDVKNCLHCGSEHASFETRVRDLSRPADRTEYEYRRCSTCGLVFLAPRPPEREIGVYYAHDYEPYIARYNPIVERFIRARTWREMRGFGFPKPRVLEIGSSWGKYLLELRAMGADVVGVELSPEMCQEGSVRHGLDIRQGTLEAQSFPSGSFDVVVMNHVVEHLYDPRATLAEVFRVLKHGGALLIKTPNVETPERAWFGSQWLAYEAPRHTVLFSPRTITNLLREIGFQVERVSYDATPNNIILSLGNLFRSRGGIFARLAPYCSLGNYAALGAATPLSFALAAFGKSGRMVVRARKKNL